jgi:hypothetical protein
MTMKGANAMWKFVLAFFLILHGLIHLGYFSPAPADPNYPFSLKQSWVGPTFGLYEPQLRVIGILLGLITVIGFLVSGLATAGVVVPQSWWPAFTAIAAIASFMMLLIFWQSWLVIGVLIDVILLVAVIGMGWQPFQTL